jgi:hypothetical protein
MTDQLLSEHQVRRRLRDEAEREGSIMAWATKHQMTRQYVSAVINGDELIGPRILKALGLEKVTTIQYRKEAA